MELFLVQCQLLRLSLRSLDANRVRVIIQARLDMEALTGSRTSNELDNGLVGGERFSAPVSGDMAKEPVLDLIPLARARREVADMYSKSCLIGKILELGLPCIGAITIAAPSISSDEQVCRFRVGSLPHGLPPVPDRRDREGWRIVVASDVHGCLIPGHIEHAIRNRFAQCVSGKIMN